jgi:hypothetical protein
MKRQLLIAPLFSTLIAAAVTALAVTPLLPQQVARVVSENGNRVSPRQIRFLSTVTSRHEDPVLDLVSICPWGSHAMKARLACRDHSECLPFFVAVEVDNPNIERKASGPHQERLLARRAPPILRVGTEATLMLRSESLQIAVPVICLENGEVGRSIRVTTLDRRRIYKAEVVSAKLLKGEI